jgi:hypothetical protein
MALASVEQVTVYLGLPSISDGWWLDQLGMGLPNLRRPRGREGDWDVERYERLPPALRAATVFFTLRAEVANGGVEQFVWNQFSILPRTIEAFDHIGAVSAAGELAELGDALVAHADDVGTDAVARFLAFRAATDGRGWTTEADPVEDVRQALLRHMRTRPEEFVVAPVETRCWANETQTLRGSILERPDARYEVSVEIGCPNPGSELVWYELSRAPDDVADIAIARSNLAAAIEARRRSPTSCSFVVSSCSSDTAGQHEVWPDDKLALDSLPLGPVHVTFSRGDEVIATNGSFVQDPVDRRGYGQVVVEVAPPDTEQWPPREPRWLATCVV